MLCRAQEWKGADLFVEALRILGPRGGVEGKIFLAPADAKFELGLRSKAEGMSQLRIQAPVNEAGRVLSEAGCVVNASRTPEPFGLTLIEAMAQGAVPVAPRAGGPLEILEEGRTGLFFSPGDPQDLARALSSLAEMQRKARLAAESRFSAAAMAAKLEDCYEEILATNKAAIRGQEKFPS
jgi:glycosyltransferase involved in cell wall biosynthesis